MYRLWLSALAWWRGSRCAPSPVYARYHVAPCTFLPYVLRGRSLCLNPDSSHIAPPRRLRAVEIAAFQKLTIPPGPLFNRLGEAKVGAAAGSLASRGTGIAAHARRRAFPRLARKRQSSGQPRRSMGWRALRRTLAGFPVADDARDFLELARAGPIWRATMSAKFFWRRRDFYRYVDRDTSGNLGNCPLPPEPKARLLIHRKT